MQTGIRECYSTESLLALPTVLGVLDRAFASICLTTLYYNRQ